MRKSFFRLSSCLLLFAFISINAMATNNTVTLYNDWLFTDSVLVYYIDNGVAGVHGVYSNTTTNVTIPDQITYNSTTYNVTTIGGKGGSAFANNTTIQYITFGSNITTIEQNAFKNCTSLKSIDLPNSVTTIPQYAFNGCTSLESVTFGNALTTIEQNAFQNCTSLKSIDLPNSVTIIGWQAFENCNSLESVILPDGVTVISGQAFAHCDNLKHVTIGEGVTNIMYEAFAENTNLNELIVGKNVNTINWTAFNNVNIAVVHFMGSTPPNVASGSSFHNAIKNAIVYVPCNSYENYMKDAVSQDLNLQCSDFTIYKEKWNFIAKIGKTFDQLNQNQYKDDDNPYPVDIAAVGYDYTTNNWSTNYYYRDDAMTADSGYFVYPFGYPANTEAADLKVKTNFLKKGSSVSINTTNNGNANTSGSAASARWFALGNSFNKPLAKNTVLNALTGENGTVVYTYNAQTGQWENPDTIKPGQGFMVAGTSDGDSATLTGTLSYPTSSNKKSDIVEDTKIIFNSVANGTTSNVYARINKNAENNFDIIDSYKMLSTANDDLVDPYFVVDNKMVLIDEFKTLPYTSPISFHASKTSEVNFSVENVPEGVNVAIVDLNTNAETDLTNGEVFNFIAEEGENAGKYAIKFTKSSVGINEVNANEISMSLYPNPAVDKTTLTINGLDNEAALTITDELGRVVKRMSIAANQTKVTINTESLSGVYYVKVVSDNTTNTQKLIVK